jgi:hypothetical protein
MLGTAQAGLLNGTFTINIYQGTGGGNSGAPQEQANLANPLLSSTLLSQVLYTGDINFFLPTGGTNTIKAFLDSAAGSYSGLTVGGNAISAGNYGLTTVFSITGSTGGESGFIHHDDGIGLYQGTTAIVLSSAPTVDIATPFTLPAGNFQLIYVAANDLPEVLQVETVPDGGTTVMLLGGALMGLGFLRRKFRG